MAIRSALVFVALASLAVGCSRQHSVNHTPAVHTPAESPTVLNTSLVGIWSYDHGPAGYDIAFRFDADGKYRWWFKGPVAGSLGKGPVHDDHAEGTYRLKDNRLRMTQMEFVPTAGQVTKVPKTEEFSLLWKGPDNFDLVSRRSGNTYTRRSPFGEARTSARRAGSARAGAAFPWWR